MGRQRKNQTNMNSNKNQQDFTSTVKSTRFHIKALVIGIIGTVLIACVIFASIGGQDALSNNFERSDKEWYKHKERWTLEVLTDHDFNTLSNKVSIDNIMSTYLPKILKVRPPGSKGIQEVKEFIIQTMENMQWEVEIDSFKSKIPGGRVVPFKNIITTLNPDARRRLVLSCHYDSKITPTNFLGATDSACPCAMMIEVARIITDLIVASPSARDLTLQLLFFDGEEAFEQWTQTDSLYGSRHLSKKWMKQLWPRNGEQNKLHSVDLLVLLDLLGEPNPIFRNSHSTTSQYFPDLGRIESRLRNGSARYFEMADRLFRVSIDDDHRPFYEKGVRVTHLIPVRFPDSWHTMEDNGENLDPLTIEMLTKIITVFTAEYLHMSGF